MMKKNACLENDDFFIIYVLQVLKGLYIIYWLAI